MAKNSGSTRRTAPGASEGGGASTQVDRFLTPALQGAIADRIARGGFVDFERDEAEAWNDMTLQERELTLMQAGFTGMTNEELETIGTIYVPMDKKTLVDEIVEALDNLWSGYEIVNETYTIGYKDGSVKYLDALQNPFEPTKWITHETGAKERDRRHRGSIGLKNVAFIIRTNADNEPNYWVASNEKDKELFMKYGGFEEWKKGRGEKRRDYIQDDWI